MITLAELKTQIIEIEAKMEEHRRESNKRAAKACAKNRQRLMTCLSYVESTSAEKIIEQRNMLLVKLSTAEKRYKADAEHECGSNYDPKNPEVKKKLEKISKLHNFDHYQEQLKVLNFILKK